MHLETDRLLLLPLSAAQLSLWTDNLPALERELSCSYQAEPLDGEFLSIIHEQAAKATQDEANALFHTFWLILRKEDRVAVGSCCFKSPPNMAQEVEIGYGLGNAFEGCGYMTEVVRAMCRWGLSQASIQHILAETDADNLPSQRVLKRCGFLLERRDGNFLWWRLSEG